MGDPRGFLKIARQDGQHRPVCERVQDFQHVARVRSDRQAREQASRCMDCAMPFCHSGCPIGNYIPEWNDYMFHGNWAGALKLLNATNNLPEITGRVCPAPCEYACVLSLNDDAVTIRENELTIIEYGFKAGLIGPRAIKNRTLKKVAIIGSGPAGLSCAAQLNEAGHNVVVFERDEKPGGILRYGIPDFKLEKNLIDRRIDIWKKEGIVFKAGVNVGAGYDAGKLFKEYDAVCLALGSRVPRDLKVPGRELNGIHFAMDYLVQSNRRLSGEKISKEEEINAKGKKVVVIGGGDTGSDCVGTAHRQGASCVVQIELLPRPLECRTDACPWPKYPMLLKTTSSHAEGGERHWEVRTDRFTGERGHIRKLSCVKGSEKFEIEADLVILAMGFLHPERSGLISDLDIALDERGNIKTDMNYMTSKKGVFSAGDSRRGQSLIVWAISEGRRSAHYIDKYLAGEGLSDRQAGNLPLI